MVATAATARREAILGAAAALLERDGREALTMRSLADRLGIKAPSLYKHFRDKAAIEDAVAADAIAELSGAVAGARARGAEPAAIAREIAGFAQRRPGAFALAADRPLVLALGRDDAERALVAFVQGVLALQRAGVDPSALDGVWRAGTAAFGGDRAATAPRRPVVRSLPGPD
jgi:AcrR family transcriptional regulator